MSVRASLARTVPPTGALLSLADAKVHLRVDGTDEDDLIEALIDGVTDQIEGYCHRSLLTQTWRYSIDAWPWKSALAYPATVDRAWFWNRPWSYFMEPIYLPRPPLVQVLSLTYRDLTDQQLTLDPATYRVDTDGLPGTISLAYNQSWPNALIERSAIQITYTAGFGDTADKLPKAIIAAAKLMLGHLYMLRESHVVGMTITENPAVCALLAQFVYREAA